MIEWLNRISKAKLLLYVTVKLYEISRVTFWQIPHGLYIDNFIGFNSS